MDIYFINIVGGDEVLITLYIFREFHWNMFLTCIIHQLLIKYRPKSPMQMDLKSIYIKFEPYKILKVCDYLSDTPGV